MNSSHSSHSSRILSTAAALLFSTAPALFLAGCYDGVSRSDDLDIRQTEYSAHKRVAMLVERSDPASSNGTMTFVFLNDQAYPMAKLRQHLWGLEPIFRSSGVGFEIHWSGADELTVQCSQCQATGDILEQRKAADNGVTIRYVGFP